jgi:hypothetical protein
MRHAGNQWSRQTEQRRIDPLQAADVIGNTYPLQPVRKYIATAFGSSHDTGKGEGFMEFDGFGAGPAQSAESHDRHAQTGHQRSLAVLMRAQQPRRIASGQGESSPWPVN